MDTEIIGFAIEAHNNVNHQYDGKPYSVHLAIAAYYAQKYRYLIPELDWKNVINAVWLHDTIEDCRLTYNDIKNASNETVAEIVYALTNEKGRTRAERANGTYYSGIAAVPFATFVKMCDRLANVKYSKDAMSSMFDVYKREQPVFISKLFNSKTSDRDKQMYKPMVAELDSLLK